MRLLSPTPLSRSRAALGPILCCLGLGLAASIAAVGSLPVAASVEASSAKPIGTTFAFPDTGGATVDITLLKVVNNAPAKGHYHNLVGKRPVVGLEFLLKNVSAKPASLKLFSSVLYYPTTAASLTGSDGATQLGSSLSLKGTMAPGSHREGWVTTQGYNKKLQKIQATLNGVNTGSWKGAS
jgi:hypothetical protein